MKNLYDTLEFNKIQEKLNLYIKTEVGKNLVNTLELSTDFFLLQKELSFVEEMMNLIVRFGTLPIINSSDLAIKIGFAKSIPKIVKIIPLTNDRTMEVWTVF